MHLQQSDSQEVQDKDLLGYIVPLILLGEPGKVTLLVQKIYIVDLQPVRLMVKEWVEERSCHVTRNVSLVAKIQRLGRGWVGGIAYSFGKR